MSAVRCSFCGTAAFYRREYEGVSLCQKCFKRSIEDKVRFTISEHKMFGPRDHIAVAVSGGKDSLSLLSILSKLKTKFPLSKLTAITIDEGIQGYRDEAISLAKAMAESLNIEHRIFSFRELFQVTLDKIVKRQTKLAPCSYCGVLRRRALEKAARTIGAGKIASGHNLDDEVQTALLNILHGGVERLVRTGPVLVDPEQRFIPRVKPLCGLYEREIALYGYLTGIEFQRTPCPHRNRALRNDVRDVLNALEEKHPGLKYTAYSSKLKLSDMLGDRKIHLNSCKICGEWTGRDLCEVCKILVQNQKLECLPREA